MEKCGMKGWAPSAAFLLKCGKEKEKLRTKFRKNLQDHLLKIWEEGLFGDLVLVTSEGTRLPAHRSLLQVRVPAFLAEVSRTALPPDSFATFLSQDQLQPFLSKVYSSDDIRKDECDMLRLRKNAIRAELTDTTEAKYTKEETLSEKDRKASLDSVFVTPISTPLTPEKTDPFQKDNKLDMEKPTNEGNNLTRTSPDEAINLTRTSPDEEDTQNDDVTSDMDSSSLLTSSMVRSSTFDLQGQQPLEEALDENDQLIEELSSSAPPEKPTPSKPRETEENEKKQAFYLHQSETCCIKKADGSMTDSGFLTQSSFSMLSEAGLTSSIETSSLDGTDNFHLENARVAKSPSPGSLFPFYIDMERSGSERCPTPGSSLYMYVDAKDPNQRPEELKKDAGEGLFSKVLQLPDAPTKEISNTLMGARDDPLPTKRRHLSDRKKRPSSCYMYIDFGSLKDNETEKSRPVPPTREVREEKKRPLSVSMFIDLNEKENHTVEHAQSRYIEAKASPVSPFHERLQMLRRHSEDELFQGQPSSTMVQAKELLQEITAFQASSFTSDQSSSRESEEDKNNEVFDKENIPHCKRVASVHHTRTESFESCALIQHSKQEVPEKPKNGKALLEGGLLPMSPILRRKQVKKEPVKVAPSQPLVSGSTRPQDIDAMKFKQTSEEEEERKKADIPQVNGVCESPPNGVTYTENKPQEQLAKDQPDDNKMADAPKEEKKTESIPRPTPIPLTTILTPKIPTRPVHSPPLEQPWSCGEDDDDDDDEGADDSETVYSEVSDVSSSLLSLSLERRWGPKEGTHPDRSLEPCSKLGEDLLRMFFEEVDTDMVIQVDGKQIKAHRCILSSRCRYFATVLKDNWDSSPVCLPGFSHGAVHFALCHLYSGAVSLPAGLNLAELTLLADMLALDSLREVVVFHLKMNLCHFFHRPCSQCLAGVPECLALATACGLSEVRERAARWLGRHFPRAWPHRAFAALPPELRELCYQQAVANLSPASLVDTALSAERLASTLPRTAAHRWAEPVLSLVARLRQDCTAFLARHFDRVLESEGFLALGKGQSWHAAALESSLLSAVEQFSPEMACRALVGLARLSDGQTEWTHNFAELLQRVSRHTEKFLIHNANRVVHCPAWDLLPSEAQRKIKDAAVIVFEFEKPTAPPPRLSSLTRSKKEGCSPCIGGCKQVRGRKGHRVSRDTNKKDFSDDSSSPEAPNEAPPDNDAKPPTPKARSPQPQKWASKKGKAHIPVYKAVRVAASNKGTPPASGGEGGEDSNKDLVAAIDADSNLVSHCLQEAELLEQQLARKLQRQQGCSTVEPARPSPRRNLRPSAVILPRPTLTSLQRQCHSLESLRGSRAK